MPWTQKLWKMAGQGVYSTSRGIQSNCVRYPRYEAYGIFGNEIYGRVCPWVGLPSTVQQIWLSQANHFFSRLRMASDYVDYGASFDSSRSIFFTDL